METLPNTQSNWDNFDDDIEWDTPESTTSFDILQNETFTGDQLNPSALDVESLVDVSAPQYIIPPKPPRESAPFSSTESTPPEIVSLEAAMADLADERYELLGHGTKSDLIPQILEQGIRAGGDGRDTDIDSNFYALNHNLESLQDTLDHWQHKDSKQIILFRPPIRYKLVSPSQHSKATYGTFYHDSSEPGVGYYEPEYIYGWYDAEAGTITKNADYHGSLDNPTDVAYLEEVYENTKSSYLQDMSEADHADYEAANEIYRQHE